MRHELHFAVCLTLPRAVVCSNDMQTYFALLFYLATLMHLTTGIYQTFFVEFIMSVSYHACITLLQKMIRKMKCDFLIA